MTTSSQTSVRTASTLATRLPIFTETLRGSWRGVAAWSVAMVWICGVYLPFYASFAGNSALEDLIASMPDTVVKTIGYDQIATGSGYVQATVIGLLGFVLTTIAAIGWGTRAIAGDEENGLLEVPLAHGVTRRQVVLEGAAALVVRMAVLVTVVFVMVTLLNGPAALELSQGNLAAGVLALWAVSTASGLVALAAGALTGNRSIALAAGAGLAVGGYVANGIGRQNDSVLWLVDVTPYGWAFRTAPVTNGWDGPGLAALLVLWIVCVVIGWIGFSRRDLTA